MTSELRVLAALAAVLIIPGWAMLSASGGWRRWPGLQGWIVAVALSIAFEPILFYLLRCAVPGLALGPVSFAGLLALLVVAGIVSSWRGSARLRLEPLEWLAVLVFLATLATRFWVAVLEPYPAWSDSQHHVLLTELTRSAGRLPETMSPYFPVALDRYHLGLYALAAPVAWLAGAPAHAALLWTAQALNGLCGLGVYLVLDRKVGRVAAIAGAITVGLLSHQPAFYVNWGRYTQVAAQSILLVAWLLSSDALGLWRRRARAERPALLATTIFAGMLSAAVILLHFRVAVFYACLLLLTFVVAAWRAWRDGDLGRVLAGAAVATIVATVILVPALWGGARMWLMAQWYAATDPDRLIALDGISLATDARYLFFAELPAWIYLTARPWLALLTGVCLAIALVARNRIAGLAVAWSLLLLGLAELNRLDVLPLRLTNVGAVLIMLYLPLGLVVGAGVGEVVARAPVTWRRAFATLILAGFLAAGVGTGAARARELEPERFFVTPADLEAMQWIRDNTGPWAMFAVNTDFWLTDLPHGTDAGYWIPYLTGRQITVGPMIASLSPRYLRWVTEASRLVKRLAAGDSEAHEKLWRMRVHYAYIGARGYPHPDSLDAAKLVDSGMARLVYQKDGVSILALTPRPRGVNGR